MDRRGETPEQTTAACDITFAMLADPAGAVWSSTFFLPNAFSSSSTVLHATSSVIALPSVRYGRPSRPVGKTLGYARESLPDIKFLGNATEDDFLEHSSCFHFFFKSLVMIKSKSCWLPLACSPNVMEIVTYYDYPTRNPFYFSTHLTKIFDACSATDGRGVLEHADGSCVWTSGCS